MTTTKKPETQLIDFGCSYVSKAEKRCTAHVKALPAAEVEHKCIDNTWKLLKPVN